MVEKETPDKFVPDDFEIPRLLETDFFRLRMLSVDDVQKDYEAVIESRDLLKKMFGGSWPRVGFTVEENLVDLERHQLEFLDRKAFAYTVISLDETKVLGCVYINPPSKYSKTPEFIDYLKKISADAVVLMWVRQSEYNKGLDDKLFHAIRNWINSKWPFKKATYPGRE